MRENTYKIYRQYEKECDVLSEPPRVKRISNTRYRVRFAGRSYDLRPNEITLFETLRAQSLLAATLGDLADALQVADEEKSDSETE